MLLKQEKGRKSWNVKILAKNGYTAGVLEFTHKTTQLCLIPVMFGLVYRVVFKNTVN